MSAADILGFFLKLEGDYKWYVLGAVVVLLTAVMTRVIFKTLKWFFILAALSVVGLAIYQLISSLAS